MNIREEMNERILTLHLSGRLDSTTYSDLDQAVARYIEQADRINFDLEDLEYLSSAGLRVMISVHKRMEKREGLYLYNAPEEIKEIFEITGFSNILNFV